MQTIIYDHAIDWNDAERGRETLEALLCRICTKFHMMSILPRSRGIYSPNSPSPQFLRILPCLSHLSPNMLFEVFTTLVLLFFSGVTVRASPAAPFSDLEALTGRATPLAQVITKCTVPNTVALTFDDGPEEYIYVCIHVIPFLLTAGLMVNRTSRGN